MNSIFIASKTENPEKFIRSIVNDFSRLNLSFKLDSISDEFSLKESANEKISMNMLVRSSLSDVLILLKFDAADERVSNSHKLIAFCEYLASEYAEGTVTATLQRKEGDYKYVTLVDFTPDENTERCFDLIKAAIKKRVNGRPFLVYEERTIVSSEAGEKISDETAFIRVKKIGTGIIETAGMRMFKRTTSEGVRYFIYTGKWPDARLGICIAGINIDSAKEKLKDELRSRGYELLEVST